MPPAFYAFMIHKMWTSLCFMFHRTPNVFLLSSKRFILFILLFIRTPTASFSLFHKVIRSLMLNKKMQHVPKDCSLIYASSSIKLLIALCFMLKRTLLMLMDKTDASCVCFMLKKNANCLPSELPSYQWECQLHFYSFFKKKAN